MNRVSANLVESETFNHKCRTKALWDSIVVMYKNVKFVSVLDRNNKFHIRAWIDINPYFVCQYVVKYNIFSHRNHKKCWSCVKGLATSLNYVIYVKNTKKTVAVIICKWCCHLSYLLFKKPKIIIIIKWEDKKWTWLMTVFCMYI